MKNTKDNKPLYERIGYKKPTNLPNVYPFLTKDAAKLLNEVLGDLRFITKRENLHSFNVLNALLFFWLSEVESTSRSDVVKRLAKSMRVSEHSRKKCQPSYEELAGRLVDALKKSNRQAA